MGKIEKMHAEIKDLGYYGVLGVKQTVDYKEIEKAYYKVAKEYHPDLYFEMTRDVKKKLT